MNIRYPLYEGVYRILTDMHGIEKFVHSYIYAAAFCRSVLFILHISKN